MQDFVYHNPTRLIFGKDQLIHLQTEIVKYGTRILFVYGGGSIKKNGLYDKITQQLTEMDAEIFELSGVEPNPRLSTVHKGIEICKQENIKFILAVGGGSVIDCSKAITVGAKYDGDVWDIITRKKTTEDALPFGAVLTIAATGSEMNPSSVITNWETQEKYGWSLKPFTFPRFSILDPQFTATVPKDQTLYGIVDMMSHVLEQYFHQTPNTLLQDRMCEAVLKTIIETAPKLVNDLENIDLRETILYSGTIALNGILAMGARGDWATHNIEHAVSAVYDIPHGGGLAILHPNWMLYVLDENVKKFKQLAIRVFNVNPTGKEARDIAIEGIEKLRVFWTSIGAPERLADYGIDETKLDVMADKAMARGEYGNYKKLNRDDTLAILKMSL
ncbi:MAG TPA: iron-containing alcohol dehydrogenase [Bacillales bacterium]|nr:iron-containing alcohol dehydrogenase [Bacillales bacterium]